MTMMNPNGGINMAAKILCVILRFSIAVIKCHCQKQKQKQTGKGRKHFSLPFVVYQPGTSGQELKQGNFM